MAQQHSSIEPAPRVVTRESYRASRLAFLRSVVALERREGLEIGALDFPTVPPEVGRCMIADLRTAEDLAKRFGIPLASIPRPTYLVTGDRPLAEQLPRRFGYLILCHVLEHIPDPIRCLNEAAEVLEPGGVLFLAVPDKRRTPDAVRASTTLAQLLSRHYHRATAPSLEQVIDFASTWVEEVANLAGSPRAVYDWAVANLESGEADVHCNVWRDEELFAQLDALVAGGFLPGLTVVGREPNRPELNEFYVALRRSAG